VRNAIARILDRYVLADIVEITLRKMRRDNVPLPFMVERFLHPAASAVQALGADHPPGSFLDELLGGGATGRKGTRRGKTGVRK
jgi:hypothetical protein